MLFIRLICTSGFTNLNTGMPSTEYKIYLITTSKCLLLLLFVYLCFKITNVVCTSSL